MPKKLLKSAATPSLLLERLNLWEESQMPCEQGMRRLKRPIYITIVNPTQQTPMGWYHELLRKSRKDIRIHEVRHTS